MDLSGGIVRALYQKSGRFVGCRGTSVLDAYDRSV